VIEHGAGRIKFEQSKKVYINFLRNAACATHSLTTAPKPGSLSPYIF
jgi:hypothetical protein